MEPGRLNAITDVNGVGVGHSTVIEGDNIRTGVTVVVPHEGGLGEAVFAAPHRLNGNGEMTGSTWVRGAACCDSPIAITNTHSVGAVRDGMIGSRSGSDADRASYWALPVVAETWDGRLNDINGFHVRAEHVSQALDGAPRAGRRRETSAAARGWTGSSFKGGIGTASGFARRRSYRSASWSSPTSAGASASRLTECRWPEIGPKSSSPERP